MEGDVYERRFIRATGMQRRHFAIYALERIVREGMVVDAEMSHLLASLIRLTEGETGASLPAWARLFK